MNKLERTLIVEDDSTTAFITRMLIKDLNVSDHVEIASNGEEALKILKNGKIPELILLDLNMPVMDGYEFLESFYASCKNIADQTKIVLLAASYKKGDKAMADQYNISELIEKPLTEDKMINIINNFF
jgi:CheY-like chemotaxis protein